MAELLNEKIDPVSWPLIDYWIYPHPYARFADLTGNPDWPPMPVDDPAAWALSPHPQKPKWIANLEGVGYLDLLSQFDAANRELRKLSPVEETIPSAIASIIELSGTGKVPTQTEQTPPNLGPNRWNRTEPFLLNLEQCLELAVINSREYQTQRENLYLTALPVSLERFNFLPQFLAAQTAIRQWSTAASPLGSTNQGNITSTVGASQLFGTGALLALRMANQTVIDFSSSHGPTLSSSTALLDLSQPFLRGGGQAVTLEPLTQTERNLLYQVRDFSHFSREFFVNIAAGEQVTVGGFGNIAGLDLTVRGLARNVGYYPTLRQLTAVYVERSNLESLESLLKFFQAFAEGGGVSKLQVDQVEQNLNRSKLNVLSAQLTYQDNLDQFKIQLGLPTNVPIELDLSVLEPITRQLRAYQKLESQYREVVTDLERLESSPDAPRQVRAHIHELVRTADVAHDTKFQRDFLERAVASQAMNAPATTITDRLGLLAAAMASSQTQGPTIALAKVAVPRRSRLNILLNELRKQRDQLLAQKDDAEAKNLPFPPEKDQEIERLTIQIEQAELEEALAAFEQETFKLAGSEIRQRQARAEQYRLILYEFSLLLEEARMEKLARLQEAWPVLPPVTLGGKDLLSLSLNEAQELAGQAALENRLDLMNQRAQVVDAWRKIAVVANSLLGTFDVRYSGTLLTPPVAVGQPFNFKGYDTTHQIFLNTELPLVRQLERNNYRASLIAFQRQRRNLQAAEDQALFLVRQNVRQLRQLAEQYRIQQRQLQLALYSVDNSLEVLRAPPAVGEQRDAATAAAALTTQMLQAQQNVPSAQNGLYQTWVTYITARMELYRDLELMQIDARGVWINDQPINPQPVELIPPGRPGPGPGAPP